MMSQRDIMYPAAAAGSISRESVEESVESSIPTAFGEEERNSTPSGRKQRKPSALGRRETRAVWWLKGMVLTVLVVAAVIVGVLTHSFTRSNEVETFENQFLDDSARLKLAYYEVEAQRVWVSTSLIVRLVSQSAITFSAITEQVLFDFDYSGISLLHLSKGESISWAPIIKSSEQQEWESFAASSTMWMIDPFGGAPQPDDIRAVGEGIWKLDDDYQAVDEMSEINSSTSTSAEQESMLAPMWQVTPLTVRRKSVMFNMLSEPVRERALMQVIRDKIPRVTGLLQDETEDALQKNFTSAPRSISLFPATNMFGNNEVSGVVAIEWRWAAAFENILQDESAAVLIVVVSSLDEWFTLEVVGSTVKYVGKGDHHDTRFDDLGTSTSFDEFENHFQATQLMFPQPAGFADYLSIEDVRDNSKGDPYVLHFYPTSRFEESFTSNRPALYTTAVLMIFLFTTLVFLVYDCLVERRQSVVMDSAVKHTSLVHELYPPEFVNRVIQPHDKKASTTPNGDQNDEHGRFRRGSHRKLNVLQPMHSLQTFLTDNSSSGNSLALSQPIAEIFPDVTVIFADICGFTAWSSEREPIQVFQLLESLFGAFDEAGKRLGVFKVETIGDCYVAVCGLPVPHLSHAVVMCRFANEIQLAMDEECKKLEVLLGPGTSELKLRIGLHSGSVIAGVLRGEKARFQLFGDLMNTCARIESTGLPGKTQISKATADLLIVAGKRYWVTPRSEMVEAKGKGELQTYWMTPRKKGSMRKKRSSKRIGYNISERIEEEDKMTTGDTASLASGEWGKLSLDGDYFGNEEDGKQERLIDWNTEMLVPLLNRLVARRVKTDAKETPPPCFERQPFEKLCSSGELLIETVRLPSFDPAYFETSFETWILAPEVRQQLRNFIADIAARYNELPFHNFEHASHVTLSSVKLLNRIAAVDDQHWGQELAAQRHKDTFGIATDPLTHFVVVLAALIHDVGHPGVPNSQLLSENHELCQTYGAKSIAERHSIHIALQMLQKYPDLQECIYSTPEEHDRFHQLLYHSVLSTDIMDSDSTRLWKLAFGPDADSADNDQTLMNRRASIVLEQIIQASDVAHTMQHWHIYRKWNEMLFHEFYDAFQEGSTSYDPRKNWYEGELGFLDNYVLPLAKRLKESGVYGVSSEEYFQHALANREEWELKGRAVTEAMIEGLAERQQLGAELLF